MRTGLYLKRITITGFKSFANKTVVDLERGITGVVGPNGSGKSNLADAIRWALGEQGKGRLRLEDREEVVFAGSAGRARASYAEVILLFDNESGAFGLDLSEVEISRRLYRSGETDYRLAGRSARLSDIQALLATAGVGAGSYAVIGQGMIDSMLMSSPSERKLLFDEASGIRGPELGREAALRKLNATAVNLTRLRDIAAELEPRLGTLRQSAQAVDERRDLEDRVAQLRAALLAARQAHWTAAASAAEARLAELAATAEQLRAEQATLQAEQRDRQQAQVETARHRQVLQSRLSKLEQQRDAAAASLAAAQVQAAEAARAATSAAALEQQLEAVSTEQSAADARVKDTAAELAAAIESAARAAEAVESASQKVAKAQADLVALREGSTEGARDAYLEHALSILKTLAAGLGTPQFTDEQIRLLVHKAGRLLSHATRGNADELLAELTKAQEKLEVAMRRRDTAIEHQTNVAITSRSLEIDLSHLQAEASRLASRRDELKTQLSPLQQLADRQSKLDAAVKSAETDLARAAAALDTERSQLATLTSSDDTAALSEAAVRLDRIKSALAACAHEHASAAAELKTARQQLSSNQAQAKSWDLTIPTQSPKESIASLTDQLARAETLLEARSQIITDQLAEYEEVSSRHTELVAQIADLVAAEADLTKLVAEFDTLIRRRFQENFQALAEQFSHYFARLFDGGQAALELTDNDAAGYGINIKASPKGKRLASITALSGGERALAGVALIAAIMKVNPSPFVVLDEIDAALDEANSGRLAGILAELQQYSQLIVITHNRQTMQAASVLFGVTMNEHHVSHLISLRLEQATRLAAR